jgi:hypothetical protein
VVIGVCPNHSVWRSAWSFWPSHSQVSVVARCDTGFVFPDGPGPFRLSLLDKQAPYFTVRANFLAHCQRIGYKAKFWVHPGFLWVALKLPRLSVPSRRPFAQGILPSAHSKETSLRPRGFAPFPTPLDWQEQPLRPTEFPEGPKNCLHS